MLPDNIQANKLEMLGKLTANLIHEIRNSLSVIKFNLEYLEMMSEDLPESVNESVSDSSAASSRIQYLVDNLLNFARKNGSDLEIGSINEMTLNVIEIIKIGAKKFNVSIETNLSENLPPVEFDKNKLFQVFLNLINNAMESCSRDGKVLIRSALTGDGDNRKVVWEVIDNGKGISRENREKIFTDFYTNKKKGTGLGLSVCKKLLDEIGAEIDFESEYGKGSRFFIIFNPQKDK